MAGSIYAWSTTAGSNDVADGDINWQEGQFPDTVNNSARQMMGRLAEFRNDVSATLTAGGTANALTVTANSAFTSLANGRLLSFRAAGNNTTAATLNANSLGAKAIRKQDSSGDVALVANELRTNNVYTVQYSTSADGGSGAWILLNPSLSALLFAIAGLTPTDGAFIVGDGTTFVGETGATARASMGLAATSTDNAVVRFDSTTGATQNSGVIMDDSNNISGVGTFSSAAITSSSSISTATGVFAHSSGGSMVIRPNGPGSGTGQIAISTAGAIDAASYVATGTGVFGHVTSGNIVIRPGGTAVSTGQFVIANGGNVTVNGTLTVTG